MATRLMAAPPPPPAHAAGVPMQLVPSSQLPQRQASPSPRPPPAAALQQQQQQQLDGAAAPPRAIFCKGLAKGTSERCIAALFHKHGRVLDCQIARHRSGRSAGFAILVFASHEEAAAAISAMDAHVFMGRPLSCRWYQQEQDGTADGMLLLPPLDPAPLPAPGLAQQQGQVLLQLKQQQQQQQAYLPDLPVMFLGDNPKPPLNPGLHPRPRPHPAPILGLEPWGLPRPHQEPNPSPNPSPSPAVEDGSADGTRRWSAMVNLWLQDYLNQDSLACPPAHSLSDPGMAPLDPAAVRRSFDGLPASLAFSAAAERRRSSRDSLSRCLDSLNLAAVGGAEHGGSPLCSFAPSDSAFLAKSRLATKWSAGATSGGGGVAAAMTASSAGGAGAGAGRGDDDFHVLADIQLLSSAMSCPPDAPAFHAAAWALPAPAAAAAAALHRATGVSSVPGTAANSPPGKFAPPPLQRRGSWGSHEDIALGQAQQDQVFKAPAPQQMHATLSAQHMLSSGGHPSGFQQRLHTRQAPPQQREALQLQKQGLGFGHALHPAQAAAAAAAGVHALGLGRPGAQQQRPVQHFAAMQQAQEHYVSALNQLTSAHTQVLVAAAALQDAGIMPSTLAQGRAAPPAMPAQQLPPGPPAAAAHYPWLQGPALPAPHAGFVLRHNHGPQLMFPGHRSGC